MASGPLAVLGSLTALTALASLAHSASRLPGSRHAAWVPSSRGTALYYKCGGKPWKLKSARDGVCYIGAGVEYSTYNGLDRHGRMATASACVLARMTCPRKGVARPPPADLPPAASGEWPGPPEGEVGRTPPTGPPVRNP
jgi:hypothetical protein